MARSAPPGEFHEVVRSRLDELDIRYTAGREQILRILEAEPGPRSAAELQELSNDDVPMSSIYRTLMVLGDAGVLDKSHGADGVARFELAEWLRGHHHHLVCIHCGAVEDVDVGAAHEAALGELADRVAASRGFTALGHRIDIEGLCGRCSA